MAENLFFLMADVVPGTECQLINAHINLIYTTTLFQLFVFVIITLSDDCK